MSWLIEEFADRQANAVIRRGGETFIDARAAIDLVNMADERGLRVLGLEGFLVSHDSVYPALSRIADFSYAPPSEGAERARALLKGAWAKPPTSEDQMHSEAAGRHMVVVVIAEP